MANAEEKRMDAENRREAASQLEELIEQAYETLDQMRSLICNAAPDDASAAGAYWLSHIDGALAARETARGSMIMATDTVNSLIDKAMELEHEAREAENNEA